MHKLAHEEPSPELKDRFEKELRLQREGEYRDAKRKGGVKQRKSKGEKKRASRLNRKHGYA